MALYCNLYLDRYRWRADQTDPDSLHVNIKQRPPPCRSLHPSEYLTQHGVLQLLTLFRSLACPHCVHTHTHTHEYTCDARHKCTAQVRRSLSGRCVRSVISHFLSEGSKQPFNISSAPSSSVFPRPRIKSQLTFPSADRQRHSVKGGSLKSVTPKCWNVALTDTRRFACDADFL